MARFMHDFHLSALSAKASRQMAWKPKQETNSEILQELIREDSQIDKSTNSKPPKTKGQHENEPAGPHWQVQDSQPTPFVNDFFLSHPDKVLGI